MIFDLRNTKEAEENSEVKMDHTYVQAGLVNHNLMRSIILHRLSLTIRFKLFKEKLR
jgi:hypothetical protein